MIENVKCIVLEREDLIESYENEPFETIDWTMFKNFINKPKMVNEIILFIDRRGQTKLLKNRWGDQGVVKYRKLCY